MPCNSDHLNPTHRERELQETARLLVYLYALLGRASDAHPTMRRAADDPYCTVDFTVEMCTTLRRMDDRERHTVLYAPSQMSARLNLWWIEHQDADKKREAQEQADRDREALRAQALAKLTVAERDALGI